VYTTLTLGVHGLLFWGAVLTLAGPTTAIPDCALVYAFGATYLVVSHWKDVLRLSLRRAIEVSFYASVVAVWFWGANDALDILGNSVRASRVSSQAREGLPLHFLLFPGVVSVTLASTFTMMLRRFRLERPGEGAG